MKCGPDIPVVCGDEIDAFSRRLRGRICGKSAGQKRFAKRKYARRSRRIAGDTLLNCERVATEKLRSDYDNI